MKHYTAEEWADFARGLLGGADKALMERHLESGCRRCKSELAIWRQVTNVAKRQAEFEPPLGAVRQVKAMMSVHGLAPEKVAPSLARLLFDSMSGPLLAGVRSGSSKPRQMLFATSDHRIDLRLEPQIHSDKMTIIGQILDARNPDRKQAKTQVSLFSGKKLLARTETNDLGEFQFESDFSGRLELRAVLSPGREISIALVEPTAWTIEEASYPADSEGKKSPLRGAKKGTRK